MFHFPQNVSTAGGKGQEGGVVRRRGRKEDLEEGEGRRKRRRRSEVEEDEDLEKLEGKVGGWGLEEMGGVFLAVCPELLPTTKGATRTIRLLSSETRPVPSSFSSFLFTFRLLSILFSSFLFFLLEIPSPTSPAPLLTKASPLFWLLAPPHFIFALQTPWPPSSRAISQTTDPQADPALFDRG